MAFPCVKVKYSGKLLSKTYLYCICISAQTRDVSRPPEAYFRGEGGWTVSENFNLLFCWFMFYGKSKAPGKN